MTVLRPLIVFALTLLLALPARAQDDETFVINLRDAEISVLVEQISEITGRTLVLDPGLTGDVTVVSAEALDREGVWSLFQSILRVRGSSPCRQERSGRSCRKERHAPSAARLRRKPRLPESRISSP